MGAGRRLTEGKQQGQIGMNAALLQLAGSLNTLPGRRNLDQHAVYMHPLPLVQLNQAFGTGNSGHGVETQSRIHFSGHTPWNKAQNFTAKTHQQMVHGVVHVARASASNGFCHQRSVFGLLRRLQDQ